MMPGPHHHLLLLFGLALLIQATRGNEIRVLARSNSLPLIQTLLDHGPLKPRMATKHNLSLQHLRFMLELYRRSADGDGRPKTSRHSGAAVRLVRPVSRASLVTEGQWHIKTFKFKVHGVINAERLVRATVMHPLALRLGVTCFSCTVDLLPNAGHSSKTRIPAGSRMWAETDLTSQLKPLLEGLKNTLYLQLQFICRKAKRCPIKQLAVSSSHIPFLLLYLNHTLHNLATEKRISLEPGQNVPGLLTRKPRQAGTIGVKLPIFPNQSGQSKNQCVLRPFWVSFHQLGWDHWIIAPHRYNPGYCKGDCPRLLHSGYNSPNHAIIQNFINQIDGSVPRPSCVPYSYGPISVLMIEPGGNILYKEYENMMAESCTCR